MARSVILLKCSSILVILMYLFVCSSSASFASGVELGGKGRKVGGRIEIEDVKTNKEVQELGNFSVEEFNREKEKEDGSSGTVVFSEVVRGQRQVVSGIKYYLEIAAADGEIDKVFDAVVVVKPWDRKSKQLISFAPSSKRGLGVRKV